MAAILACRGLSKLRSHLKNVYLAVEPCAGNLYSNP